MPPIHCSSESASPATKDAAWAKMRASCTRSCYAVVHPHWSQRYQQLYWAVHESVWCHLQNGYPLKLHIAQTSSSIPSMHWFQLPLYHGQRPEALAKASTRIWNYLLLSKIEPASVALHLQPLPLLQLLEPFSSLHWLPQPELYVLQWDFRPSSLVLEHSHLSSFVPESKGLSTTLLTSQNWSVLLQPTTCIAQPLYVASLRCCTSLQSVEASTNPAQLNLSSAERASGASAKLRYHAKEKRTLRPFLFGPQRPAVTTCFSCGHDVHWYTFISICACHHWVRYSLQLFGHLDLWPETAPSRGVHLMPKEIQFLGRPRTKQKMIWRTRKWIPLE